MTVKRVISLIVGTMAAIAGLYLVLLSFAVLYGYGDPEAPNMATVMLALVELGVAGAILFESYRLLRSPRCGWCDRSEGWVRPVLLGIGFFFPGFVFSLPFTLFRARQTWPGDGQSPFAALEVSAYVGVAAAIICCVVLLKKRRAKVRALGCSR